MPNLSQRALYGFLDLGEHYLVLAVWLKTNFECFRL
jgi:hypothetical protein